jgi:hypothetical protein
LAAAWHNNRRSPQLAQTGVVTTVHTPLATGQFWTEYTFADEGVVLDEQLDIDDVHYTGFCAIH